MHFARLIVLVTCMSAPAVRGEVFYVDADASAPGGGDTWCSAFADLQDALAVAAAGDEIRIAAGTYKPDGGTGNPLASFEIPSGVEVKGGYAGCGEANPDLRDVVAFETILSGDLLGDDGDDFANYDDNSFSVVRTYFAGSATVLDGLTIERGNGNGPCCDYDRGGGMSNFLGGPTVRSCTFRYNAATSGGAIANNASDARIIDCAFERNTSAAGGAGIYNYNADVEIQGGYFSSNGTSAGAGGAIYNHHSNATVTGVDFLGNTAQAGAAIGCTLDSCGLLQSCSFEGNTASTGGGALYLSYANDLDVRSCAFTNNASSYSSGGAVVTISGNPHFADCTFDGNGCGGTGSGGAVAISSGGAVFDGCTFRNNYSNGGAAGAIIAQTSIGATLRRCMFEDNYAERGGAVYTASGPLVVDGCSFVRNEAFQDDGGAVYSTYDAVATVSRSSFIDNVAIESGGGIVIQRDADVHVFSSVFRGNVADEGGGACIDYGAKGAFFGCAFIANTALSHGGGAYSYYTSVTGYTNCTFTANDASIGKGLYNYNVPEATEVTNCILWNNNGTNRLSQIAGDEVAVSYSCVQGGHIGTGNILNDPRFIDTNGPDGLPGTADDDLRLRPDSPCINVGTNALVADLADLDGDTDTAESVPVDLGGHARTLCTITDMGAHEFGLGDFDCDRTFTTIDFAAWDACLTGPNGASYPAGCVALDADFDADVDLIDFAAMQEIVGALD